jgi:CubicO group peptidase (beta-lactamase class C family)
MHRKVTTLFIICLLGASSAQCQSMASFADSIRRAYHIPELNYAVVSAHKILELHALGYKKINTHLKAQLSDRFRIGSNTKTVTSYIATLLVQQGKLKWDTKFFDLYPELKATSNPAYYAMTLQDLLTFRVPLMSWTYTNNEPLAQEIKGNEQQQRYAFVAWVLKQAPVAETKTIYWSNPSYVAAGLMLEKATGKDYKTFIQELGKQLAIHFEFGQPNCKDTNQTWGHNEALQPEAPSQNYKLNWLSSAGNLNVSLPDYIKFVQLQLQGLSGQSKLLSAAAFNNMHYGLPDFSFGWNWYVDEDNHFKYSFHKGNPGTFFTEVYICKDLDRAFIFFTNAQTADTEQGIDILFDALNERYGG